jgi:alkanesulfonate monooxygenase SsuD/methylene tetrahydromethanopterin reductase-like flavin-dependent oxidoreductase (luciferase family)
MMKFGLLYEHQYPRPWSSEGEQKLLDDALEQVELADKLGIDYAWEVEHHFLEEYSHSSAPEVFLAAASQRTKNIRLGHGIRLMPPGYNAPARVAEAIATLDLVSHGRVDFGTGESGSRSELEGFGVSLEEKHEMWLETTEQVANMLAMDPYPGFNGKYFSMPARNIVPKPVQKPHPPLWVACSNRDTIHLAAQRGLGALTFTFVDVEEARKWAVDYYATFKRECVPLGHTVNPNIAIFCGFSVHHDEEVALERGIDGIRFFQFANNHYYGDGVHTPGRSDLWAEYTAQREELIALYKTPQRVDFTGRRGAIGTPAQVRATLRAFAECGIDQVVFIQQGGKNRHEDICASLELFAKEVMPEFHDEEEARQRTKAAELAPFIEQAFERKQRMRPLADHEIPTIDAYRRPIAETPESVAERALAEQVLSAP